MSFGSSSLIGLLASLLTVAAAVAQDAPLQQQQRGQESIQGETGRIGDLLEEIVVGFDNNGLSGSDVDTVRAIRSVLGRLAEKQMPTIVETLARGRAADTTQARQQHLLTAYGDQASAAIQLRQLLAEHQLEIELNQLAVRVQDLGDRQSRNLHETITTVVARAKEHASRRASEFQISRQLQETEQRALKEEMKAIVQRLTVLAGNAIETVIETRPREAVGLTDREALGENLSTAQAELARDRLMSAASYQRRARNTQWRLASVLAPARDRLEQLLVMRDQLERMLAAQTLVITESQSLRSADEVRVDPRKDDDDDRVGRMHPQDVVEREAEDVQKRQAGIVDQADFMGGELQPLAPHAAALLRSSIDPMQEVRAVLGTADPVPQRRTAAIPLEEAALAKLREARDALLKAIEEEKIATALPGDKLEATRALLERVRKLKEEEIDLSKKADAAERAADTAALAEQGARQQGLEQIARQLQADAAVPSPQAAEAIGQAAASMTESATELAAHRNAPGPQQNAIRSLERAEAVLAEQLAALEEAQALGLANPAAALASANLIAQAQQQVAKALSQLNPQVCALQALQKRQQAIADQLAEQSPTTPSPTAAAQQAAAQAASQLGQHSLPAAIQSMQQALAELAQAAAQNGQPLGQLAQEQATVKKLAEQLLTPGATPAVSPLNSASGLIAPLNAGAMGVLPAPAADALQAAQSALAQAAALAAANSAPPSQASAQAAQTALAQAAAALSLSQAGLGMAPGKGPGKGPGQGQGQGQGQPGARGTGKSGNWAGTGGADGPRRDRTGASGFIGLPGRQRESLRQSRTERYPQQFREEIEQYFRRLSEAASGK